MNDKNLKIAIYSGEIPSTTFIERLIVGLLATPHRVYLFGAKTKAVDYSGNVVMATYTTNRLQKLCHLLKYTLLLLLFKRKDKRSLDAILKKRSGNLLYAKVKSYPVLWHRPHIFHIQWAKGLEDWLWVQEFGMKLVLSLRGAHINYSPIADEKLATMYRRCFPQVDGFHAVSKTMAQEAQKYGASAEKIKVIYSGLPQAQCLQAKTENTTFKILSVGRSHWNKGYHYALDAMNLLKNEKVAFEYSIIGGNNSEELHYQVADLKLGNEVRLLGQRSFTEVQQQMQAADVVLLCSMEEGIANVVLEAMQLGTLVISTNCGGMNEVIDHGGNGFLVPIRNPQKIAEAIMNVKQLSQERKVAIIEKAKNTISMQHSDKQMIEYMVDLYKDVMVKR